MVRTLKALFLVLSLLSVQTAFGQTYSISGFILDFPTVGVTLRLRSAGSYTVIDTDYSVSGGGYSFTGLADGDYTVVPSVFGYEYTPGVTAVSVSGANVTGINFNSQLSIPLENRIYGTITGPGAVGATITLATSPPLTTTTDGQGYFIFPDVPNGTWTLTPSLAGFTFTSDATGSPFFNATVNDYDRLVPNFSSSTGTLSDQTITNFTATPSSGVFGGSSELGATASSGLPVTFGSDTPAVCTVSGSTVNYLSVGTCTVTADQAGDANYNPAPQVTLDITVTKADQTITALAANPAAGSVGGSSTLSATASSGLPVTFGSSTLAVCTVSGSTVNYLSIGTCTVTADQTGDANYNPAQQVTLDIGVGLLDQAITNFAAAPSTGVVGGSSTLSATGGASGNPVVFGSSTPTVCTVAGSTVSYVTSGTCTVTADQAGDASYNPAPQVTLDIPVAKADQAITNFVVAPSTGVVNGSSALSATGGASGSPVVFGSGTPAVCTVAGSTVSYVAAGTCTVTADQAGDANYNAAPQVTLDVSVAKADQVISVFTATPATGVVAGSSALSATASSGLTVTFASSTPAVCNVAGTTVSYLAVGTCTVSANQAGDANYNAAPQLTLDIAIGQAAQTISAFTASPGSGVVGRSATLSATASSGLPVTFGSSTLGVCTVAGATVNFLSIGTCTVTADQSGDVNYTAAPQVTLNINVTEQAVAIPTLSTASLLAMLLAILMIGGVVIRRKSAN